jgi:putative SbcD/Mre11-related phosphoesterase
MKHTRHELCPGLMLDARRAVYLENERVLAVADLHLGYAWAHRHRGQLLPLSMPDDTESRLTALLDDYQPRTLAILGDIVHEAVPVREFREDLTRVLDALAARTELCLIAGNHDRRLAREVRFPLLAEWSAGPHRLRHGDGRDEDVAKTWLAEAATAGGRLIIGHEHPALTVSDQVAHFARVPCFYDAPPLLIIPAFSQWAAGNNVRRGDFLSAVAQVATPLRAFPILAGKLLPLPL